ncbi:dihydrolipoamide acetyltransferase family protein [Thermocrinis minervae]|uniref:Dihydrolipoamide acetyltransferase component of pyruvate dehydrogenase complex n=1 Tax=Thermocrinis minervae TaxID=381751 RepID=A0A1M6TK16_9AQUI|nr:dihydrolipoamide acetyltransferase family protein [Thermocrinis minervae]SHK57253.1 pyruvate dehydrogenase E2 component (dihydrolipoamide acetyltransferase) [Thermocrinis minervae]
MDYEIVMPQFSDTMERGKVVRWLKKEGEFVQKGDVIAEIEAEKAVMELQAFKSGILKAILVEEGQEVEVGKPIALLELKGEATQEKEPTVKEVTKQPKEEKPVFEKPKINVERLELPSGFASPYAKVLAKEYNINLEELQKEGRLPSPAHAKDVQEFLTERYFTPKALELLKEYELNIKEVLEEFGEVKITEDMLLAFIEKRGIPRKVPVSSVQKALIANLTKSVLSFPYFHIHEVFDFSFIPKIEGITLTHWIVKIVGDSMQVFERLRAIYREDHYLILPSSNVSVAVAVGEDLYNPVVKSVEKKNLRQIANELNQLRKRAEEKKLSLEEIQGATLTVSNLGMLGIRSFDAVLPYGHACIVAVGAMDQEGKAHLTFTFNHVVLNGFTAALFVKHLKERFSDRDYINFLLREVS